MSQSSFLERDITVEFFKHIFSKTLTTSRVPLSSSIMYERGQTSREPVSPKRGHSLAAKTSTWMNGTEVKNKNMYFRFWAELSHFLRPSLLRQSKF